MSRDSLPVTRDTCDIRLEARSLRAATLCRVTAFTAATLAVPRRGTRAIAEQRTLPARCGFEVKLGARHPASLNADIQEKDAGGAETYSPVSHDVIMRAK